MYPRIGNDNKPICCNAIAKLGDARIEQFLDLRDIAPKVQEQDSDQFALRAIHPRYGPINHALDFFQRLKQNNLAPIGRKLQLEFLVTHPFPTTRIKDLQHYARQQHWSLAGAATDLTLQ